MKPICPSCNVEMEESFLEIPQLDTHYNAMKCPKCHRVMISDDTVEAFKFDLFMEQKVSWAEHDRIMRKFIEIDMKLDPEDGRYKGGPPGAGYWKFNQLISYFVRNTLKYISRSDKICPRCSKEDGIWVESMWKVGKVCGCKKCDWKWFYEFP